MFILYESRKHNLSFMPTGFAYCSFEFNSTPTLRFEETQKQILIKENSKHKSFIEEASVVYDLQRNGKKYIFTI